MNLTEEQKALNMIPEWVRMHNIGYEAVVSPMGLNHAQGKISGRCPDSLEGWTLREQDRADYRDWFPLRVSYPGREIRCYLVNINPEPPSYDNYLCLRVTMIGVCFIDEWKHGAADPVWNIEIIND